MMQEHYVRLTDIAKSYHTARGRLNVLKNSSVTVDQGKFVALQGASGSGKSTLLLIAGGLLSPDQGEVSIMGKPLHDYSKGERARFRAHHIGFVFQQFHLAPYLTVMENILAPSLAVTTANARERAFELAAHFGLSDRVKHRPSELSTGERQRTALARALFNKPEILLADEPTGNLDEKNAQTVLSHLRAFARSGGCVLMVTHDSYAASQADHICTIDQGRCIENKNTEDAKESCMHVLMNP